MFHSRILIVGLEILNKQIEKKTFDLRFTNKKIQRIEDFF